jgi:antitoxin HicB
LIAPPVETVAKAALHSTLRGAKITKVQLAKQLGIDEKEVRNARVGYRMTIDQSPDRG